MCSDAHSITLMHELLHIFIGLFALCSLVLRYCYRTVPFLPDFNISVIIVKCVIYKCVTFNAP